MVSVRDERSEYIESDEDSYDSEVERELEERIRQAQEAGCDKIFEDVSDNHSVMSMSMSHTMSNMNFIPIDTDLDNLVEELLLNQNPNHVAELERQRNEQLAELKKVNEVTEAMIFTEENQRNVEELKQLTQLNLAEFISEKPKVIAEDGAKGKDEEIKVEEESSKLQIVTDKTEVATIR